ncbi:MAG: decaprenylphospho-beta-D-erythro-pentofuranosid-2-ulose 2-reductase [Pseudohongiellaceae bacterium]|jgi:decaprenylphospho-beta-D-erythro-pentofuranosid-2-ulose 2-reductase
MGRSLARLMAARGDSLCLMGRDAKALELSAKDLEIRGAVTPVTTVICDLADEAAIVPAVEAADLALGSFDTVVVTAAVFASQEELEQDGPLRSRLLTVNFVNTIQLCEAARERLLERGGGTLCVFSSVAGERGRKPVGLYGATKSGLSHYLESLDHRHRSEGLVTITVKPGFVKTSMTEGLDPPPFAGEPDAVAQRVLRAIDQGWPVVYCPAIWSCIMLVIRLLPRAIMRRIGF